MTRHRILILIASLIVTASSFQSSQSQKTKPTLKPGLKHSFAYTVRDQVSLQRRFSDLSAATTVGYSTFTYDSMMRPTRIQHLNSTGP